ncbi:MAG TPA: DUF1800 domain-containing protein, partial [Verrucomicrobia bacterium]|nr:DUF1800 domain-containing protein [Verrucomicrobiota bacterium]
RSLVPSYWPIVALLLGAVVAHSGENKIVLSLQERTVHALNRLGFGPRPGQVDQVVRMGWHNWAEQQLYPDIIEDNRLERRLSSEFPSMSMSMEDIYRDYTLRRQSAINGKSIKDLSLEERREFNKQNNRLRAKLGKELTHSVLVRAVESNRQFQEVMVEFWRNHLNVYQKKVKIDCNHYEENVLRKHSFGRFEDLLMASAKHPAMLAYLDNRVSKKDGLNENYAREIMELHTLGVDNAYSQKDVIELARVLTGWTSGRQRGRKGDSPTYGFFFNKRNHDMNPVTVVGKTFTGLEGVADGENAIRHLAGHEGTAKFISTKLCRYLVNDNPSPRLVNQVALVFLKTKGDLRKVYRSIIFSAEFMDPANFKVKFKTPFEFVVSSLRSSGAGINNPELLSRAITQMGQGIYQCDVPTGYSDQAEAWLDPGVLALRWEYAIRLTQGKLGKRGKNSPVSFSSPQFASWQQLPHRELAEKVADQFLPGSSGERSSAFLEQARDIRGMARLALGSPEFQQQ